MMKFSHDTQLCVTNGKLSNYQKTVTSILCFPLMDSMAETACSFVSYLRKAQPNKNNQKGQNLIKHTNETKDHRDGYNLCLFVEHLLESVDLLWSHTWRIKIELQLQRHSLEAYQQRAYALD